MIDCSMNKSKKLKKFYRNNLFGLLALAQILLLLVSFSVSEPSWILTGEIVFLWFAIYIIVLDRGFHLKKETINRTMIRYGIYFLWRLIIIAAIYSLLGLFAMLDEQQDIIHMWVGFILATCLILGSRIWILQKLNKINKLENNWLKKEN